ncbi:Uncharacterised protein [Streptococcus pneumoniae]|nr:Uncharacterised protein [Streptococcus pneumoniae]
MKKFPLLVLYPNLFTKFVIAFNPRPSAYNLNISFTIKASFSSISNFVLFSILSIFTVLYPNTVPPFHFPSLALCFIPIFTFSTMLSRSNSPIEANTFMSNFPVGVAVSNASLQLLNPTLFLFNSSTILRRSK